MTPTNIINRMENVVQRVETSEISLHKASVIIRACNTSLRSMQMIITANTRMKIKRTPMIIKIRRSR